MTDIDLTGLDEPLEIPHQFVIELNCLVVVNHQFTLDAIERNENEELERFSDDDPEVEREIGNQIQSFYDALRRATNNQAAVALVTRMQHWISSFVTKLPGKPTHDESRLVSELNHLNQTFGDSPVPINFFSDLVNVRDSVIHGDSKAKWRHGRLSRRVADCYSNDYGDTEISSEQLKIAIAETTRQVLWYDDKVCAHVNLGKDALRQ
jgi:hypothetical protein